MKKAYILILALIVFLLPGIAVADQFLDSDHGFSMSYPDNWSLSYKNEEGIELSVTGKDSIVGIIRTNELQEEKYNSLDDISESFVDLIEKERGFAIIEYGFFEINNIDARNIIFIYRKDGKNLKTKTVIIEDQKQFFFISLTSEAYAFNQRLYEFEKMLQSFSLDQKGLEQKNIDPLDKKSNTWIVWLLSGIIVIVIAIFVIKKVNFNKDKQNKETTNEQQINSEQNTIQEQETTTQSNKDTNNLIK